MIDNLALYRYFYETAMAGSISAAAKKLYVTQPAVSSMIGNLEKELNTTLFFRTKRKLERPFIRAFAKKNGYREYLSFWKIKEK
jgi:hypothetical protein